MKTLKISLAVVLLSSATIVFAADVARTIGDAAINIEQNTMQTGISAVRQKEQIRINANQRRANIELELSENERQSRTLALNLSRAKYDLKDLDAEQQDNGMKPSREFLAKKVELERQIARLTNLVDSLTVNHERLLGTLNKVNADEEAQIARIDAQAKADRDRRVVNEGAGIANQIFRSILGR